MRKSIAAPGERAEARGGVRSSEALVDGLRGAVEAAQAVKLVHGVGVALEDDDEFEVLAFPGPGCNALHGVSVASEHDHIGDRCAILVTDGETLFLVEVTSLGPMEKD